MASTTGNIVNAGILNNYSVRPRNLTQYNAFRGVTDFTQLAQFDPFEKGYSFLSVIQMPKFMTKLAQFDENIKSLVYSFKHKLEYEFRGLSGLTNIEGAAGTISDGINELQYINKVTMDTSIQVSMNYYETSGSLIQKFTEYYLTGIKDRISQAKTYHGLIRHNQMAPGIENEVFTLLYYVTDATMLRLERAYLLANAQITSSEASQYDAQRTDIGNVQETTLQFNCFPIMGYQVDKAASALLKDITGVSVKDNGSGVVTYNHMQNEGSIRKIDNESGEKVTVATLDSNNYLYGVMDNSTSELAQNADLISAIEEANKINPGD